MCRSDAAGNACTATCKEMQEDRVAMLSGLLIARIRADVELKYGEVSQARVQDFTQSNVQVHRGTDFEYGKSDSFTGSAQEIRNKAAAAAAEEYFGQHESKKNRELAWENWFPRVVPSTELDPSYRTMRSLTMEEKWML